MPVALQIEYTYFYLYPSHYPDKVQNASGLKSQRGFKLMYWKGRAVHLAPVRQVLFHILAKTSSPQIVNWRDISRLHTLKQQVHVSILTVRRHPSDLSRTILSWCNAFMTLLF